MRILILIVVFFAISFKSHAQTKTKDQLIATLDSLSEKLINQNPSAAVVLKCLIVSMRLNKENAFADSSIAISGRFLREAKKETDQTESQIDRLIDRNKKITNKN